MLIWNLTFACVCILQINSHLQIKFSVVLEHSFHTGFCSSQPFGSIDISRKRRTNIVFRCVTHTHIYMRIYIKTYPPSHSQTEYFNKRTGYSHNLIYYVNLIYTMFNQFPILMEYYPLSFLSIGFSFLSILFLTIVLSSSFFFHLIFIFFVSFSFLFTLTFSFCIEILFFLDFFFLFCWNFTLWTFFFFLIFILYSFRFIVLRFQCVFCFVFTWIYFNVQYIENADIWKLKTYLHDIVPSIPPQSCEVRVTGTKLLVYCKLNSALKCILIILSWTWFFICCSKTFHNIWMCRYAVTQKKKNENCRTCENTKYWNKLKKKNQLSKTCSVLSLCVRCRSTKLICSKQVNTFICYTYLTENK